MQVCLHSSGWCQGCCRQHPAAMPGCSADIWRASGLVLQAVNSRGSTRFLQTIWGDTCSCHLFVSALIGRLEKGTSVR